MAGKKTLRDHQATQANLFARQGNLAGLKKLIAGGADVNAADSWDGFRPLISAAAKGRLEVVKYLLKLGIAPDVRITHVHPVDHLNGTALMLAAYGDHRKIGQLLLKAGADVNASTGGKGLATPLEFAVHQNNLAMAQMLLKAGAKLTPAALNRAAMYGYLPLLKLLLKGRTRKNIPFSPAIVPVVTQIAGVPKGRRFEVLDLILNLGADVNGEGYHGDTGLINAVKAPDVKLLGWLLKRGAKLDYVTKSGATALHYAAALNHCDCVRALLAAGADANLRDADGRTPLATARFRSAKDVVKLFQALSAGRESD